MEGKEFEASLGGWKLTADILKIRIVYEAG